MKLALYSGVLALGVGDAMAAVAGNFVGRRKWPGELVGTEMCIII